MTALLEHLHPNLKHNDLCEHLQESLSTQRGLYFLLMNSWLPNYVNRCKSKSIALTQWKTHINSSNSTLHLLPNGWCGKHNCAHQCIYGLQLFSNKEYRKSIKYFRKAISVWPNRIIQCALSTAYRESKQFKACIRICKCLLKENYEKRWNSITQFQDECCIELTKGFLDYDINENLFICYQ
eukprot:410075_1